MVKLYPEYVLLSFLPLSKPFYFNHLRNLSFSFSFLGNLIKFIALATVYHLITPRPLSGPHIPPKLQICTFGHLPNFSVLDKHLNLHLLFPRPRAAKGSLSVQPNRKPQTRKLRTRCHCIVRGRAHLTCVSASLVSTFPHHKHLT